MINQKRKELFEERENSGLGENKELRDIHDDILTRAMKSLELTIEDVEKIDEMMLLVHKVDDFIRGNKNSKIQQSQDYIKFEMTYNSSNMNIKGFFEEIRNDFRKRYLSEKIETNLKFKVSKRMKGDLLMYFQELKGIDKDFDYTALYLKFPEQTELINEFVQKRD